LPEVVAVTSPPAISVKFKSPAFAIEIVIPALAVKFKLTYHEPGQPLKVHLVALIQQESCQSRTSDIKALE